MKPIDPANNVIDLAEFRQQKLMNQGDGVAWLRAFVANNRLSRGERTGPATPRRPSGARGPLHL